MTRNVAEPFGSSYTPEQCDGIAKTLRELSELFNQAGNPREAANHLRQCHWFENHARILRAMKGMKKPAPGED